MKKSFLMQVLVLMAVSIMLVSCSGGNSSDITGAWRTENVGYYTETTFNEDGTFESVYKISDADKSAIYGISQEMLDAMNSIGYYVPVSKETLTDEELALSTGEFAIKVYPDKVSKEADENYFLSFYDIDGDTLVLDGCVYTKK